MQWRDRTVAIVTKGLAAATKAERCALGDHCIDDTTWPYCGSAAERELLHRAQESAAQTRALFQELHKAVTNKESDAPT